MNWDILRIALPLLVFAFLFQNPVRAQSMGDDKISQAVSEAPVDQGADPSNPPLGAASKKPTDLLGDIWKQADRINAAGNGGRRADDLAATTLKLPVADHAAAANK